MNYLKFVNLYQKTMKIAVLMNEHSYVGREFISALNIGGIQYDILVIDVGNKEIDEFEEERCGGLWNPLAFEEISIGSIVYHFQSLRDPFLLSHLAKSHYDIGIQGGVGILKRDVIDKFAEGILNFHPGKLPFFRGCTTPEWQLLLKQKVVATCHLIAEGIDSGAILNHKELALDYSSYERMRSSIYPTVALFVVEVLKSIISTKKVNSFAQDERIAKYYKPVSEFDLIRLKEMFPIVL